MIIVNIKVPALEKEHNFSVDENAPVSEVIEEVVELIAQKEGVQFSGNMNEVVLCSQEPGFQCARESSLNDYGIYGGAELILV